MLNPRLKENKIKRAFIAPFRNVVKFFSKTIYVKLEYYYITKTKLNLKNPIRYTEKLQYLRLYVYPKDELVIRCTDRIKVRDYLKENNLEKYLVPIYGTYDKFEDIDFSKLPQQFVIKCTHASGFNYLCKNKDEMDIKKIKKIFDKYLRTDYGKKTVERHYSKIKPQIIIEQAITNLNNLPTEYKIHVFNGTARNLYVVSNRGKNITYDQFYIDWTSFPEAQFNGWNSSKVAPEKPSNFLEMVALAEKLAKPFPFVRVDLYSINNKIYFSELTFTPAKGTLRFDDIKADYIQGEFLNIDKYLNN